MLYDGVSFVDSFWKDKTEAEFIAHESHHGFSDKQLKEVFALMNPKKKVINKEPVGSASKEAL